MAVNVESLGMGRQSITRENSKVVAKYALGFHWGHALLIEALPHIGKAGDGAGTRLGLLVIGSGGQRQRAESHP